MPTTTPQRSNFRLVLGATPTRIFYAPNDGGTCRTFWALNSGGVNEIRVVVVGVHYTPPAGQTMPPVDATFMATYGRTLAAGKDFPWSNAMGISEVWADSPSGPGEVTSDIGQR